MCLRGMTILQEAKFFVGSIVVACSVLLYNDKLASRGLRETGSASAVASVKNKMVHSRIAATNLADSAA